MYLTPTKNRKGFDSVTTRNTRKPPLLIIQLGREGRSDELRGVNIVNLKQSLKHIFKSSKASYHAHTNDYCKRQFRREGSINKLRGTKSGNVKSSSVFLSLELDAHGCSYFTRTHRERASPAPSCAIFLLTIQVSFSPLNTRAPLVP